jgi:NADPH-dependent 2,4-dienoyl-CoA reductase/sulfur reductase-like enzyme
MHLGRSAVRLDVERRRVVDDPGAEYRYRKLLLATGGTPRRLPFGNDEVIYFRTLQDYRRLRELTDQRQRFVIIGGGFIGSEIAAALAMNGKRVTMLFPEQGIGAGAFPAGLAHFLSAYYAERGVDVKAGRGSKGSGAKGMASSSIPRHAVVTRISSPPVTSLHSTTASRAEVFAWSTKTMPIRRGSVRGNLWRGARCNTAICHSSTPICSTLATRPSGT